MSARKGETLTIRLSPETRALIEQAQRATPYFPTITSVVERGLVLALRELEVMAAAANEKGILK